MHIEDKEAKQENVARCEVWIGTVLRLWLMRFQKSIRTWAQTRTHT